MKAILCDKCGTLVTGINFGKLQEIVYYFDTKDKQKAAHTGKPYTFSVRINIKGCHPSDKTSPIDFCPDCLMDILKQYSKKNKKEQKK